VKCLSGRLFRTWVATTRLLALSRPRSCTSQRSNSGRNGAKVDRSIFGRPQTRHHRTGCHHFAGQHQHYPVSRMSCKKYLTALEMNFAAISPQHNKCSCGRWDGARTSRSQLRLGWRTQSRVSMESRMYFSQISEVCGRESMLFKRQRAGPRSGYAGEAAVISCRFSVSHSSCLAPGMARVQLIRCLGSTKASSGLQTIPSQGVLLAFS